MIIWMETANKEVANVLAMDLNCRGMDVQVKNGNGQIVLAALNITADSMDPLEIKKFPGVQKCERSNVFFDEHYGEFHDAYLFFLWGH